jgi:nitroreductase
MNETLKTIANRYSCRAFKDTTPSDDQLSAIANAAIQSPSARNQQRWHIVVVKNKALISELETEAMRVISEMEDKSWLERIKARGGKLFYDAPCIIFVPIKPEELVSAALDCGIVCQTIALAATSVGLASCIHGLSGLAFAKDKAKYFKEKLSFPDGYEFGASVLIGEPAKEFAPHVPNPEKITFIE